MTKNTIGVWGLGSESTLFYLQNLNEQYQFIQGGYSTCPFKLHNSNFNHINPLLPAPNKALDAVVTKELYELKSLRCSHYLVPNITLHETLDGLSHSLRLIHPVELAKTAALGKGFKELYVFGTVYSMQSEYLKTNFANAGIILKSPTERDRLAIDAFRKRVYSGIAKQEEIDSFQRLLNAYCSHSAVLLACTELSLHRPALSERVLDTAQLQIVEAIRLILK